jgi:hypothetical protein
MQSMLREAGSRANREASWRSCVSQRLRTAREIDRLAHGCRSESVGGTRDLRLERVTRVGERGLELTRADEGVYSGAPSYDRSAKAAQLLNRPLQGPEQRSTMTELLPIAVNASIERRH